MALSGAGLQRLLFLITLLSFYTTPSYCLVVQNSHFVHSSRAKTRLLLLGTAHNNNENIDSTNARATASTNTSTSKRTTGDNTKNNGNEKVISYQSKKNIALSYMAHWEELLTKEYRAAADELNEKRRTWNRQRLEASGISLFGASAEPDSEVFGDKIVRIYKNRQGKKQFHNSKNGDGGGGGRLLRDKFSRGDVLVLTPENNFDHPVVPRECLVVDVGDDWLTVAVGPTWPTGLWENRRKHGSRSFLVRLDRSAPQAPLKAQRNALERLRNGDAGKAAFTLAGLQFGGNTNENYLKKTSTIPLHFDLSSNELEDEVWNALKQAKRDISFNPNQSQMDAIAWALQRHISLIRGPPGTGKTRCASLLIATALKIKIKRDGEEEGKESTSKLAPPRILAVTHSNGAADVLLEALLQMGVPAVRLGRPSSVAPNVQHRTVVAIADKIPAVVRLRQKISDSTLDRQTRAGAEFDLKQYVSDTKKMIIKAAPVVVASCIGANQLLNEDVSFPIVVLDEAAQTTEPALLCALSVARAGQVILIGDTKQLPPTITSMELRSSLGVSPMSRLETEGVDQVTLCVQYRMPPALLEHPSNYFYDGLVSCSHLQEKELPGGFPWPDSLPLAFIQSGGNKEITHHFNGKSNPTEANLVERVISGLIDFGDIDAKDIAVITPYSKQVQLIRMNLSLKGRGGLSSIQQVKVGTVDSFQGQETQVVIFSAVRSNEMNEMGFLRDPRRLNVAITRAKRGLILIGDKAILRTCRHWSALLDSCERRGCLIDINTLDVDQQLSTSEQLKKNDGSAILDDSNEFYGLFSSSE